MVPVPTSYLNVPVFGSGASNVQPVGSTYSGGFLPGQLFPAEYENWLMNGLTTNSLASQTTSLSVAAEIVNILNQASIVPDPASTTQLYAALNALYATVGGLSTEASARASADTTLQSNINAEATARANADALLAPLTSPALTGIPTAPTPSGGDNSTKIATTAYTDAAVALKQSNLNFILDYRNTSGSTTRTETVNNLAVGQTAEILWNLSVISGGSGSMTIALPSTGTYVVAIYSTSGTGSNRMVNGSALMYASIGTVAGGTTFTLNTAAPTTTFTLAGKVYRVS